MAAERKTEKQLASLSDLSIDNNQQKADGKISCDSLSIKRNSPYASSRVRIVDKDEMMSSGKFDLSLCQNMKKLKKSEPAMTAKDFNLYVRNLQQALTKDACMTYVEWGSGGSTFVATEYSQRVVSIENDPEWCETMLASELIQCNIALGRLTYICVDGGDVGYWGHPLNETEYASDLYLDALNNFHHIRPDLVLVDGRYRVACTLNSLNWAKPDTLLMLHDYRDRNFYQPVEEFFDMVGFGHVFGVFKQKPTINSARYKEQLAHFRKVWI